MKLSELKPCPFCGNPSLRFHTLSLNSTGKTFHSVWCATSADRPALGCGAQAAAGLKWNQRVEA